MHMCSFEGAWTAYEVSKFIKTNGIQVQVVTTGGVRRYVFSLYV
jgi:hypothetical protein